MDALTLARWQFATTSVYHFFFVPLTLGLVLLVALMETIYVRTNNPLYKQMTQFWGRLLLINFALGVATGIVQEFQYGMDWASYSRFVGDIFGAPLAIEALLAFFLESTFLGVWLFGWDRLSKKVHLLTIWLVVSGSYISALWILVANSFMQEPVGYTLRHGRAEMTNFFALLGNTNVWMQLPHVLTAGMETGSFFVLGISAYHLLRKEKDSKTCEMFRRSVRIAGIVAVISSLLVGIVGIGQMFHLFLFQPMKMAAAGALWNDVQVINNLQAQYEMKYGPGNYVPPVGLTCGSFILMIGAGVVMILLSLLVLLFIMRGKLLQVKWLLRLLPFAIFLPYLANSSGWIMAEVGRQPWIVFGLLTTSQGVSPVVNTAMVLTSLLVFTLLYGALAVVDVHLLAKYARRVEVEEHVASAEPDLFAQAY